MRRKKHGDVLDPTIHVGYELLKNREAINYAVAAHENESKAIRRSYTEAYAELNKKRANAVNTLIKSDNPEEVSFGKQLQAMWKMQPDNDKLDDTKAALVDVLSGGINADLNLSVLSHIDGLGLNKLITPDNTLSYLSRLNSTQADSGVGALQRLSKYEDHINNYLKVLDAKKKIEYLEQQEAILNDQAIKTSDPKMKQSYLKRLYQVRDSKYAQADILNAYQKDVDILEKADPTSAGAMIDKTRKAIEDFFNPLWETTPLRDVLNDAKAPLYDLKSKSDAEKRNALQQSLRNIADIKPLLQANVDRNLKDAAYYERRISPEFVAKRDTPGMDFFDADTYLYKMSGVMGSSGTSWRTQLASAVIGTAGGLAAPFTGGASVAAAAPIVFGLNYAAGIDENQAEVAIAARETFTAMLGGENSPKYKQFIKDGRAQLPKNISVPDSRIVDMYLTGQIVSNKSDINRAKVDVHKDIEALFTKDMVATTADGLIDTVLEVMPFGKSVSEIMGLKNWKFYKRASAIPRYLRKKGGLAKEAYEIGSAFKAGAKTGSKLFSPLGVGGTTIGAGIGGATNTAFRYIGMPFRDPGFKKLCGSITDKFHRVVNAVDRVNIKWLKKFNAKPAKGILGDRFIEMNYFQNRNYGLELAKRLGISGVSEGIEEGKQYQNAEDFKKGYDERQLRTDVISLAFDDFLTGLDVGRDILSIPLDPIGILKTKDKDRLAEVKGGMLAGLTHVGSIGIMNSVSPYLEEKSANKFLIENMLTENVIANDKLDKLMHYSNSSREQSGIWGKIKAGVKQGITRSNRLQALEKAFANFKELNQKEYENTGDYITSPKNVDKEFADFRRTVGLTRSTRMQEMAERAGVDTNSDDYGAFVATYMMAADNLLDKSKQFAKNESERNTEANKILNSISIVNEQVLEDAGVPRALWNNPRFNGAEHDLKRPFVERLARLQALLETKQELEDALKAGANRATMRRYIDGIERQIDIVKNGQHQTDPETGEQVWVRGLSDLAQLLYSVKIGVDNKGYNLHVGESINTLDDIAAVSVDQEAQDKLADIYRQSYLEQFNMENANAALEQITGTTKIVKDENGEDKVVVDKPSGFNTIWDRIKEARNDNDVFWNELTSDAFKTDEELEADKDAGEVYESGWNKLRDITTEYALDEKGDRIKADGNTKLKDDQTVSQDGYVLNITKESPIKERLIFTPTDQDEVSKSGEYQETVESIAPEIKIAYGYENSSNIGLVTQQVGEAKQQMLEAKESEKRAKEAARLRAELKRKLEKEADEKRKAFIKLNPKYEGKPKDQVDAAIAKHEKIVQRRKQREQEREAKALAKQIEKNKLTRVDGKVHIDKKGISHKVYQRKDGTYVTVRWDELGNLKQTVVNKNDIISEKQGLINDAYTELVKLIKEVDGHNGDVMRAILSKIQISDLSKNGILNTYTQLYKLRKVAGRANSIDIYKAVYILGYRLASTGYVWNRSMSDYDVIESNDIENDYVQNDKLRIDEQRLKSLDAPIIYHNGKIVSNPTATVERGMSLSDAIKKARSGDKTIVAKLVEYKKYLSENLEATVADVQYPGDANAAKLIEKIDHELDELNKSPEQKKIDKIVADKGLTKTDDVYTYKDGRQTSVYLDKNGKKCILSKSKKGYRVNYTVKFDQKPATKPEPAQPAQPTKPTEPSKPEQPTQSTQPTSTKPADKPVTTDKTTLSPQQQTVQMLAKKRAEDKLKVGVDGYELTGQAYFIKVNGKIQRFRRVHATIPAQTLKLKKSIDHMIYTFEQIYNEPMSDKEVVQEVVSIIEDVIKNGAYVSIENGYVVKVDFEKQADLERHRLSAQAIHDLNVYLKYLKEAGPFDQSEFVGIISDVAHIIASTEPGISVHIGNVVEGVVNYVVQRVLDQGYENIVGTEEQLVDEILNTRSHDSFKQSSTPESGEYGSNRTYDEWFNKNRGVVKNLVLDVLRQLKSFHDLGWVVQSEKLTLYGEFKGVGRVAGEPDLIAIDQDGGIHMIDIKTSKNSFYNGKDYSSGYVNVWGANSWGQMFSTQTQYSNQQTAYRMLMKASLGMDTTAELMPYIVDYHKNTGLILNVVLEPRIPIVYSDFIEAMFNGVEYSPENFSTMSRFSERFVQGVLDTYNTAIEDYNKAVSDFESQIGQLPKQFMFDVTLGKYMNTLSYTFDEIHIIDAKAKRLWDITQQIHHCIEQALAEEERRINEQPTQPTPEPTKPEPEVTPQPETEPESKKQSETKPSPDKHPEVKPNNGSTEPTGLVTLQNGYVYKFAVSFENPYPQIQSDRAEKDTLFAAIINAADFGLPETTVATISNTGKTLDKIQIKITYKDRKTGKVYNFGKTLPNGNRDYLFINAGNNLPGHAVTENFRALYNLAAQLTEYNQAHPGKRAVLRVTEWYRTDGRLMYEEKNGVVSQENHPVVDPKLGIITDDLYQFSAEHQVPGDTRVMLNDIGFVKDGAVYTYGDSKTRHQLDVVSKDIPNGVIVYSKRVPRAEAPGGFRRLPVVLRKRALSDGDVNFIMDVLKDPSLLNQEYNRLHGATIGSISNLILPIITDAKYLSPQKKLFVDRASNTVYYITVKEWKDAKDGVGTLKGYNMSNESHVEELKQIIKGLSIEVNSDVMQSRFGTDTDSNLPLKAIREWFNDNPSEKTFTVRGSLGNTSISFDRSDFQDHKADNGDVYNGLSGAGWYLRSGILQTNAVGIGAPHVHINAVTMDTKGYPKKLFSNGAIIDDATESKQKPETETKPESKTNPDSKKKPPKPSPTSGGQKSDSALDALSSLLDTQDDNQVTTDNIDNQSADQQALDNEQIEDWELFHIGRAATGKTINKKKARRHAEYILGKDFVSDDRTFGFIDGVIKQFDDGSAVLGVCRKDSIRLSSLAENGVEYHEAFHRIFELIIPEHLRDSIYEKVAADNDIDLQNDPDYTNHRKVAELMADWYWDYQVGRFHVDSYNIFAKAWNRMRDFALRFTNRYRNDRAVLKLFSDIRRGKYASRKANSSAIKRFVTNFKNNLMYKQHGKDFKHIVGDEMYYHIVESAKFFVFTGSDIAVNGSNISDLNNALNKETILKGAQRLADAGNDILGINLSEDQRSEGQKALFELIDNLDDIQFKLDLANSIKVISTNFEQVESEKADNDADAGDTYSINQSIEGHIKDAVEFDPFEKTSQQIRFFFATIPNQKWSYTPSIQNGKVKLVRTKEQVFNDYGLPEFIPVRDAYNKFINIVHNVDTLDELIDTLNKKAQIEPFYETIAENIKAIMDKRMSYDGDSVKYDIDAENLLVQIMVQARSNKYNMVTMMSSSAGEGVDTTFGEYKTRIMPTGVEYQARNTAISWSSNFANGGTNLVKITKVGKRAINDKDADAASVFSNFSKFLTGTYDNKRLSLKDFIQNAILGKLGLKQYLGLPVGNKVFKIQDIDDVSMQLCKEYIVQQLNSMGINIELNAFNYMLVEKYGSAGAEALLKMLTSTNVEDSMTTFIQFLNSIVVNNQLNITDDNKFYVGSLPVALDLIYTKFAFTSNLANWQYRYKQATTQLSVKGSGDNLKYVISQNNFLTDSTRDFNKRGPQFQLISSGTDPYIYSTRTDPNTGQSIWAGSFVLNGLLNNDQAQIELQLFDGFRTDNKGDYGADYFQITNDEDMLCKMMFLMDNTLTGPTMSDKKSYYGVHLKGIRIPGIDYSHMYDNSGKVVVDGNALGDQVIDGSYSYDIAGFDTPVVRQRQDVIDQFLSYAYAERESIIKTIDALSEMTEEEKKNAVKNFYTSENGAKFSSLLGIWPVTKDGAGSYVSFNNAKLTPKQALEKADKNFFTPMIGDKPMTEREANDYRRTVLEMVLQKRLTTMMMNLRKKGFVDLVVDGERKYWVNKGLPADAIEFIAKSLLRSQNRLDAAGNAIDQNSMREAISSAIVLFANDMVVKHIMSVEEHERLYASNPGYFKWKYDQETGVLTNRLVDQVKRNGGDGSTGINNFTELTNIPEHWLDKDGQFTGEYRCCEIKDEEIASPQIEKIKRLMISSSRTRALREYHVKKEKSDYDDEIFKTKRDERPGDSEQLYQRKRISKMIDKKLAAMNDYQIEQELRSLGILGIADEQAKVAYESYAGGIDVNDGAAYITDDMCEMLLRMVGSYSSEVAEAFKVLRSNSVKDMYKIADAYTKVITTVIGSQKYTAKGRRVDAIGNITDYYHKYALFPVFPMLASGKMGNIYSMMKNNDVDMVLMSSAVKVGSQGAVANPKWDDYRQDDDKDNKANYNKDGSLKPVFSESFKVNPYSVSFEYLRKQLNTDPNEKKYMNIGSQATKVALASLNHSAMYLTRDGEEKSGQELLDDIMNSMKALSNMGMDQINDQYFLTNDEGQFVDEEGNVVIDPIVDPVKYSKALKRTLGSDKISLNLAQALQLVPYKDGKGKIRYRFNMPLDAVQSSNFLESKIISSINKSVIDTKTPGAAFIQRSVWSAESATLYDRRKGKLVGDENIAPSINGGNRLQMVNEEGSMDCVLSVDFFTKIFGDLFHYTTDGDYIRNEFGNRIPVTRIHEGKTLYKVKQADMFNEDKFVETWVYDINDLPDGTEVIYKKNKIERHTRSFDEVRQYLIDQGVIGPNAKTNILAYRIPTQAQASTHALRCVDIMPVVNDTVMLPAEFTRVTGSDFDIDKLFLTGINYRIENGVVTSSFDKDSEKYHQNKIVTSYLALLTDVDKNSPEPRSFISLHRSIDNDTQLALDALKEIDGDGDVTEEQPYQFYDITTQTDTKNQYVTGKTGIGPYALNNNNHILTWLYHVSFKPSKASIMSVFDLTALDDMTDIDGKPILGWISAFINGHVDCAKDPWPPRTNANPFTYNISNLLLRTGWGKNTIFFLRQPIMLAMAQAYMRASSEYMSDGTSQFRRQQQAIDNVVFGEDSKYHLENVQVDGRTVPEWMDIIESQDGKKAILKWSLNATLSTILTRKNMLAQAKTPLGKMGDTQFQAAVYLAYKQFDKYASALSNLVKYCKIDTKKHGKSLAEQLVWYEGYNDLFNNGESGELFNSSALHELKKFSYIGVKTENAIKATKYIVGGQFFSGSRQFIKTIENLSKLVGNENRYETVSFVEAATKAISASIKSEYFNYYVNKLFGDSTYVRDLVNGSSEQHTVRYHYDKKTPYIEVDEDMIYPLRTYIGKPINISWKTRSGSQMKAYPNVIVAISGNKVYLQKEIQFNSKGKRSPLTVDANIDVQFTQGNNTIYDRIGTLKTLIENNSALADLKGNILLRDIILAATQKYTPSYKRIAGEASDTYDDLKFIKLETFFEDNGDKTDQYIRAWDSLLRYTNDNESLQNAIRKLANDLVVYAFITSGDTKGSTKLFQYVPDSWRNGEFNPEGVTSYAGFIRNKLDELNGYGETKIDLDDVILNNWQNDQFVPRYRVDDKAEQQKLTPIYTDGRNTYGYPVVIQGMNIEKPADKNNMPKVNVVIDPTKAPQYIKITRDYKHRNSQRQYSIYKFHSVAQTADEIRYPIYVKVEPKGITIKSSGGTYMVTEYGRSDRLDKAENSTIPELFELLYTAQNFQDQLRGMPKSDLRDSNILQDLRRFAELDMAEKMSISSRSYSANMDIAQTQAVQFNDTDAQSQVSTSATNTVVNPLTISDKTEAFGVTVDPKLKQNYKQWLVDHPNGIVAYRIDYNNFNTAENVNKSIIGNPFDWQKYGQEKSLQMFYEWLTTGVNYNEALATDEYRNAIINKLLSTDKPEILYYKELGHPSHATVLGYLIEHKELLQANRQVVTTHNSTDNTSASTTTQTNDRPVNIYFDNGQNGENIELSNFAIRPFIHTFEDGIQKTFQSVEQAFHYIKGLLFATQDANNNNVLDDIMNTTSGGELRRLGHKIKGLDVTKWDANSSDVMKRLLKESFEQNPQAAQRLLNAGNATLTHTQDRSKWKTEFPRLLMEVRDELRKSQNVSSQDNTTQNDNSDQSQISTPVDANKQSSTYKTTVNPETALFYSGGAIGSDTEWGNVAQKYGFDIIHYTVNDYDKLSSDDKESVEKQYKEVVERLQRRQLRAYSYSGKLVRRDMLQANSADSILAIGRLGKNGHVDGGTAYATERGIIRGIPVYLFDQDDNHWKTYDGEKFINCEQPNLTRHAALIGTRQITDTGKRAIQNVFSAQARSQQTVEDSKPKTSETKTDEDSKPVQQIKLTAGQEAAKKAILNFIKTADASKGEYFILTGKAGTGKTTLIQEVIREIAKDNPYQRFVVSALAHKAVQVIYGKTKKSSKLVSASTVASLLGMKLDQETGLFNPAGKNAKIKLNRDSILFVDEASMLNEQNIKLLIDTAIRTDSKVIFLGDLGQLPPIRTGDLVKYGTDSLSPVFKTQKDEYSAGLTERVRQGEGSPILDYADTFWNYSTTEGQTDRRVNDEDMSRVENAQGSIEFINEQQADKIVPLFKQAVETNNPSLIKVVAYHNKTVKQWNQIIRRKVYGDEYSPNPLPGDILMMTDTYNDPASNGAKPLLLNNEDISVISTGPIRTVYRVQLMDATIKDPRGKIITVPLIIPTKENMDELNNNKRLLWNEAQKYKNTDRGKHKRALDMYWSYGTEWAHVEYGYAITSHKSQGSTYDVSIVDSADINSDGFMSDISKARSIYTAITRARNSAVILRDKLGTLDVDLKQLNDRINGYKDGSVTPPAQITPDTVDNVGNTYKENVATLESDKTILSNEEILKLRPFTGNDKAPRIAVASEHTDPVFFAKKIKDFFEGKTSVQPRFGQPITAKDIDALYIITKHDGLPLRDILSIKIPKIIHFSITGLGGTKYEPGIMPYNELLDRIGDYIKQGLDPSMVTVRIDPIVPGVTSQHVIENIIKRASSMGIKNIRFSIMDFYATTAQFTEANGFDYSKYYVPQTNADGSQRVLLVSRDGRSFSKIDGISYRQVGKSIAVLQSYGAESKVYLQGKSGNVWVKTVQTSNITDDVIKSKDGWTVLNDKQVVNDQVASRVKAGVHLQKLYETHAKKTTIENIANIVKNLGDKYGVRLSTCAEPDILPSGISHEGCLSVQAINDMLHTHIEDKHRDNNKSRPLCECYGGKTDILKYNDKCASSCAYCYAHHNSNAAATIYNPDGSLKHNAFTTTRRDTEEFDDTDIDSKFIYHCKGK